LSTAGVIEVMGDGRTSGGDASATERPTAVGGGVEPGAVALWIAESYAAKRGISVCELRRLAAARPLHPALGRRYVVDSRARPGPQPLALVVEDDEGTFAICDSRDGAAIDRRHELLL
jgi:hypothetical protein